MLQVVREPRTAEPAASSHPSAVYDIAWQVEQTAGSVQLQHSYACRPAVQWQVRSRSSYLQLVSVVKKHGSTSHKLSKLVPAA